MPPSSPQATVIPALPPGPRSGPRALDLLPSWRWAGLLLTILGLGCGFVHFLKMIEFDSAGQLDKLFIPLVFGILFVVGTQVLALGIRHGVRTWADTLFAPGEPRWAGSLDDISGVLGWRDGSLVFYRRTPASTTPQPGMPGSALAPVRRWAGNTLLGIEALPPESVTGWWLGWSRLLLLFRDGERLTLTTVGAGRAAALFHHARERSLEQLADGDPFVLQVLTGLGHCPLRLLTLEASPERVRVEARSTVATKLDNVQLATFAEAAMLGLARASGGECRLGRLALDFLRAPAGPAVDLELKREGEIWQLQLSHGDTVLARGQAQLASGELAPLAGAAP